MNPVVHTGKIHDDGERDEAIQGTSQLWNADRIEMNVIEMPADWKRRECEGNQPVKQEEGP